MISPQKSTMKISMLCVDSSFWCALLCDATYFSGRCLYVTNSFLTPYILIGLIPVCSQFRKLKVRILLDHFVGPHFF